MLFFPDRPERTKSRRFPGAGGFHDQVRDAPGGGELFNSEGLVGAKRVGLSWKSLLAGGDDRRLADLGTSGVTPGLKSLASPSRTSLVVNFQELAGANWLVPSGA